VVPPFYDSLLAKLIVTGTDRADALARMRAALAGFTLTGIDSTLPFLRALLDGPEFASAAVSTGWVEAMLDDPEFLKRLKEGQG